jgi:DNA-binding response OmpR family regulator/uncharacterized protein (DUF2225 family)
VRHPIAVIDDDEDMRTLLRHALEIRGYEVLEFESTEEALGWENKSARGLEPPLSKADLILLDLHLPGLSGVDSIRLIKETETLKRIPIAMLTAHSEADSVLRCVRAGASDYFVKPLAFPDVIQRIEKLIADPTGSLAKASAVEVSSNFQEVLVREIKRSERSSLPLALVVGAVRRVPSNQEELASDEIERLWSTPSGEETELRDATQRFLQTAREKLREYDTLVPFGRGELVGILPGADHSGLETVLRKLHRSFSTEAELPALSRRDRWVLILGGALYPDDAGDSLGLFAHAESGLTDRIPEKPSGPLGNDFVYPRTIRCPACNHHFTYPKIASRRLVPVGRESDMRLLYDEIDPLLFGAVACSNCGIAALEPDLKFLRHLEPPAFGWKYEPHEVGAPLRRRTLTMVPEELAKYLSPPYEAWIASEKEFDLKTRDLPDGIPNRDRLLDRVKKGQESDPEAQPALGRYLLARETYALAGASPLRRGRLAHRTAWIYRSLGMEDQEKSLLTEALGFYLTAFHFEDLSGSKPNELEILYLLGELSFRIGKEADAVAIFHNLVRDSRLEANEAFRKRVRRRWYEARHEEPPAEEDLNT